MPKRKGITFTSSDVAGARIIKDGYYGEFDNSQTHYGKIFLKSERFPPGGRRAQKVFLKRAWWMTKGDIERELAIRAELRKAGLPVLKSGIVKIGKRYYLAMEPYFRGGGTNSKLFPINVYGKPIRLAQMRKEEQDKIIPEIAKDTAKIYNLGIGSRYFDFIGFYQKKDSTISRLIMDTTRLKKQTTTELKQNLEHNIYDIAFVLGNRAKPFLQTLKENLQSNEFKKVVEEAAKRNIFWLSQSSKKA